MPKWEYAQLNSEHLNDESGTHHSKLPNRSRLRRIATSLWLQLFLSFIAGILATVAFIHLSQLSTEKETDFLRKPGLMVKPIDYDKTYPGPPTSESEQAWLDLTPNGMGYLQHDELDDGIVAFTVFHQLHCLMAIRHLIYDSWNGSAHAHMTPHHGRHCLEYIRQTVMCSADTNLEPRRFFENEPHQATGWGLHHCNNYERIKDFAEEWRVFDGKTPSTKKPVTDPEVIKDRVIFY